METMKQPAGTLRIGVVYPQTELRGDPGAVRQFGTGAEDLGFDHILTYDHVLGAVHAGRTPPLTGPYTEHDPFHDPLVMFAYLAGITERIGFATGVLVLPQRQTALVARQAADVDLLSGGRLRLGIGVGWNHVEYEALGQDFGTRGARQEEQAGLLRRLFTEPVVDFRAASTGLTGPRSCRGPRGRCRSGWAARARPRSSGPPGSRTASSSSAAAPAPSTPGSGCVSA
jgi:alkanesulfonate monooxygenase SsuD/methylene tetrahydromethanopterin reductase-like flavin-dependent oxidoreductase (luciferase family)